MNSAEAAAHPSRTAGLAAALHSFQAKANGNPHVASLIRGWNPVFHLESTDTGLAYSMRVEDRRIESVAEGHIAAGHVIRLLAREADLIALFTGGLNPVEAHFEGTLEVYGDSKDQVKLDAITIVLWNA